MHRTAGTDQCGLTITRHQVAYATLWRPKLYQFGAALPSGTRWPMPPSGGPNFTNLVRPYHQAPGGLRHPLDLPLKSDTLTNVVPSNNQAPGGLRLSDSPNLYLCTSVQPDALPTSQLGQYYLRPNKRL